MPPARNYQIMEGSGAAGDQMKTQNKSHKRKRDSPDQNGQGRQKAGPGQVAAGQSNDGLDDLLLGETESSSIEQQLAQQLANANTTTSATAAANLVARMPHLTVPRPTELSFQSSSAGNNEDHVESSFEMGGVDVSQSSHTEGAPYNVDLYAGNGTTGQQLSTSVAASKPAVGTEEWHKVRKDNHKEVERRRRETINEGINELAKIVPGCDKNKGAILNRAIEYITQLKENEKRNIEKWTLEKMLTDQAIQELSTSNGKVRDELERMYDEVAVWKKRCIDGGWASKEEGNAPHDNGDS